LRPNGSQAQDRIEAFDDGLQQYVQDEGEPDQRFSRGTAVREPIKKLQEITSMKLKNVMLPIAAAVAALAAGTALADDNFAFHGYMRAGPAVTGKGGDHVCFQLPGAFSKYRLGNECENYGELEFDANVLKAKDGATFTYVGMLGYTTPQQDGPGNAVGVRQSYVQASNIPGTGTTKFWAGKRYYQRNDIHISDFFYWNDSGVGGGVEDVDLGFSKLSAAWLRQTATGADQDPQQLSTFDFRLSGINTNPDGQLTLGAAYVSESRNDNAFAPGTPELKNGWWAVVQHQQSNVLGTGYNKAALQYGRDAGSGLGEGAFTRTATTIWRAVDQLVWQPTAQFSGMFAFVYQDLKTDPIVPGGTGTHDKWLSLGVRPIFMMSDYFGLQGELGYDQIKPESGSKRNLWKATFAPTIRPGGAFFSRPELRAFITYAKWNSAAQDAGIFGQGACTAGGTSTSPFGCATNGTTYGLQAEAWW
jgi:maltoporin